jgi:acyl carrier protein
VAPPEAAAGALAAVEATIAAAIVQFLVGYHPAGRRGGKRLAQSRNLWREVGSLTLLQLVAFVEDRFAIRVQPIDFAPQNFESVTAIAAFVAARMPPDVR